MPGKAGGLSDRIGGKRSANAGARGTTGAGTGMSGKRRISASDAPEGSGGSGHLAGGGGKSRSLVDHDQEVADRHGRAAEQTFASGGKNVLHPHGTEKVSEHRGGRGKY